MAMAATNQSRAAKTMLAFVAPTMKPRMMQISASSAPTLMSLPLSVHLAERDGESRLFPGDARIALVLLRVRLHPHARCLSLLGQGARMLHGSLNPFALRHVSPPSFR